MARPAASAITAIDRISIAAAPPTLPCASIEINASPSIVPRRAATATAMASHGYSASIAMDEAMIYIVAAKAIHITACATSSEGSVKLAISITIAARTPMISAVATPP